jgi:polysaccharide pyruvyl transferase WcaK-like protein
MVSLDGLDEIHDRQRGTCHNFDSVIFLLKHFKHTEIPTLFACTITTANAPYVDELLEYAIENKLCGRFRIADFIDRLHNESLTNVIRSFDRNTSYHLGLFFYRLQREYERNNAILKTYKNIQQMVSEDMDRTIGCPYQKNAVVLNAYGDLLYCSPHSPNLGSALHSSASRIFFSNIKEKRHIKETYCRHCIHDYHDPFSFSDRVRSRYSAYRREKYELPRLLRWAQQCLAPSLHSDHNGQCTSRKTLIVGWYGTETAGDKAILWSLIRKIRERDNPPSHIYVSSLFPFVTRNTLAELELPSIQIIETYSKEFEKVCRNVDEIIMGGGPLMDIKELDHVLYAFLAGRQEAVKRIEGCGIGPLNDPQSKLVVSEILRHASTVSLRDSKSLQLCINEFGVPTSSVKQIDDPAIDYVRWIKEKEDSKYGKVRDTQKQVSCYLKEWEYTYSRGVAMEDFLQQKSLFESQLANLVLFLAQKYQSPIKLLPMHCFSVGGDDRVFNRKIMKRIQELGPGHIPIESERLPMTAKEIIYQMIDAKLNICMRYHSVVFAETLSLPYVAIDYTQGGKIRSFLSDRDKTDHLLSMSDLTSGNWKNVVEAFTDRCQL